MVQFEKVEVFQKRLEEYEHSLNDFSRAENIIDYLHGVMEDNKILNRVKRHMPDRYIKFLFEDLYSKELNPDLYEEIKKSKYPRKIMIKAIDEAGKRYIFPDSVIGCKNKDILGIHDHCYEEFYKEALLKLFLKNKLRFKNDL